MSSTSDRPLELGVQAAALGSCKCALRLQNQDFELVLAVSPRRVVRMVCRGLISCNASGWNCPSRVRGVLGDLLHAKLITSET